LNNLEEHLLHEKSIPDHIKLLVFERDRWSCRSCNRDGGIAPHHVTFRSEGGTHHPDNLVTVCFDCHRNIHDGILEVVVVSGNFFFGGKKRWR
jgi:5-methylcytosine-specific restriction endonuclease McrA